MDEVRKVAKAYYDGAAGAEKELARKLFRSLDTNGDGKVSLREYKKAMQLQHSSFSGNDIFKELDANCDGTLDYDEVLALYYMDKVSVPRCRACKSLLLHSYFSCLLCQADASYYLCCDCYGGGKFKHRHSANKFVDTRAMLKLLDQILKQSQVISQARESDDDQFDLLQDAEDVDDQKLTSTMTQGMTFEEELEEEEEKGVEEDNNYDEDEDEAKEDKEEEDGAEDDEENGVGEDNNYEEGEEEKDEARENEEEDRAETDEKDEEDDENDEEEEDEEEEEEEEEDEDDEEEEDEDEVDKWDNANLMDRKAVKKKGQLRSEKSNRSQKVYSQTQLKTVESISNVAGQQSKHQRQRKRDKIVKIAQTLDSINTAVSLGSAVVSVGAIAVATSACCIM